MSPLSILLAPVAGGETIGWGETIAFWILGPLALAGGLAMVFARNAVHSALWLAQTMLCLGALYMAQQAPFLGFVQIIVYTGAIMMLFLFVLMLVGVDSSDSLVETLRGQRFGSVAAGLGFGALLIGGLAHASMSKRVGLDAANAQGNVQGVATLIFTKEQLLAPLQAGMEAAPHPMYPGTTEDDYYRGKVTAAYQAEHGEAAPDQPVDESVGPAVRSGGADDPLVPGGKRGRS